MEKYLIDFVRNDTVTAGSKAESDINLFLKPHGFKSVYFDVELPRAVKYIFEDYIIQKKIKHIKAEDLCVFQYSLYSRGSLVKFAKHLSFVAKKLLYIHDITSLREQGSSPKEVAEELSVFNLFDCLIVHNESMKKWLEANGVIRPMVSLEIFDYAHTISLKEDRVSDYKTIVFAGNLDKSQFLNQLSNQYPYFLYGLKSESTSYSGNVHYLGSKTATEIPSAITPYGFGLIWDGPEITSCTGMLGEYMRYNNPHKTSLYLSSGLPVIIWKEAALASFVQKHRVGLVVESLTDIDSLFNELTTEEYQLLKSNAQKMADRLRSGYYTVSSVEKACTILL